MNVALCYTRAGHGHIRAADAVAKALIKKRPGLKIHLIDVLDFSPSFVRKSYLGIYNYSVIKAPQSWGFAYSMTDSPKLYPLLKPIRSLFNRYATASLVHWLNSHRLDWIISTHFLSAELFGHLKKKNRV